MEIQYLANPTAIKFGEVYTLPPTWYNGTISTATIPSNSFKFVNETGSEASAVLFKTVISQDMPFYISSPPVDPWTNELMSPSSVAALWFQNYAEARTMVSVIKSDLSMFGSSSQSSLQLRWQGAYFVENNYRTRHRSIHYLGKVNDTIHSILKR
ncbi:hypothetical protein BFJ70_g3150 [Fusarium oxysporum]|nr:hypothetical protein BFJ70_g3150 [Fusarium oxysporum]